MKYGMIGGFIKIAFAKLHSIILKKRSLKLI